MDLPAHERAECLVNELVPRDRPEPGELRGDDARAEMDVVVRLDTHGRAGQSRAYQIGNGIWGHGREFKALCGVEAV